MTLPKARRRSSRIATIKANINSSKSPKKLSIKVWGHNSTSSSSNNSIASPKTNKVYNFSTPNRNRLNFLV